MSDFLAKRRARVAAALPLGDAVLVVGAGAPVPLPENTDQIYPFRAHTEYYYLTALECPHGVVAYDPHDGAWHSFVPTVTEAERVWEGREQPPGTSLAGLAPWLAARHGRPIAALGTPPAGVMADATLTLKIREAFTHARRPKDAVELSLLRRSAAITAAGYARLPSLLQPGLTERAVQVELEAEFFRHGATRTGYGSIVGLGRNSAVLHFEPGARRAQAGDFVLIDAGAELDRYVTDVTRTYVIGEPGDFQRDLYQIVLAAEERAITRCVPGAEWRDLHLAAAVEMTAGLVSLGVLHGQPESLVEQEAHTLFFPHGLGHMVGLGVRDAGGQLPGRPKDPRPSLQTLRLDLPLAPGYVVTVEPGLYFIPALLNDPARRARYRDCVNWPLVESHLALGGVRIEDNILVTEAGPENLTAAIPKEL
ncbi:MAG: aminopeptidase P family protein [Opitutaceae bacterium]|jgi:Xaa-Pro aminopeptidase|nr:aminopeptidase P family protein [Opitutaceae bacterium]MBP9913122.1 aminopeptidase P family protein [Opitutaceae bacterium]